MTLLYESSSGNQVGGLPLVSVPKLGVRPGHVPATFRKKRQFKQKVRHKSDYGLTYIIEIPLEYHIRLRTNLVRGRYDKDFEFFYR